MYKKVIFYNHFGNGDIFESREFVKEYMKKIPAENYYYAHGKHPSILADIPELKFTDVTEEMSGMNSVTTINNVLHINTWIGRDSKYVLPGIGCVVEKLYEMHNDILRSLGISPLEKEPFEYVPSIDYSYYYTKVVDLFLQDFPQQKVLISNGNVQSGQAENFDFTPAILRLADALPEVSFILTEKREIVKKNVFFTADITQTKFGFDLNEVSYLSRFCDTIIGRNSGPHVFTQVRDNWLDPSKATLSFTKVSGASHFIASIPTPMKKLWSSSENIDVVYQAMYNVITRNGENG